MAQGMRKSIQDKKIYIIAGPNGSGKTTFAKGFVEEADLPFLNADEIDIERRFARSKTNFWNIYRFLADDWKMFFNSKDDFLQVAVGERHDIEVINESSFSLFKEDII